jgi:hypothetical protein
VSGRIIVQDHCHVAPFFKLRFDLADIRLDCPAEDVNLENSRGQGVKLPPRR